jgi:DNA (cytosine-5)-methyltransferase 1
MVDQLRPKWFIWENVAGVLSSNGGRDFGSILGAMAELGYVFGWRVLDAQHFGVPQRRRRLFLVGCASGDIGDIRQVLFEPTGVAGNSGSLGATEQDTPAETRRGVAFDMQAFGQYGDGSKASTVKARDYKDATDLVVYENNPSDARLKPLGDKSSTVIARWGTGGNNVPLVHNKTIRRLTPVEVERLQGFPDNHTNIPWNRKEFAPDSRRYKAMGNSMAVPVMQWLGRRIQQVEESRV